jgi:protein-S-isoprenylcysteine O-methyltransferase Ste14
MNYGPILAALWLLWVVYWAISACSTKRDMRRDLGRPVAAIRVMTFASVLLTVLALNGGRFNGEFSNAETPRPFASGPVAAIGMVHTALGIGFATWARVIIGRNWGRPMSQKENPELVTGGPYACVRHPIYSGLILAMIGTALVLNDFEIPLALGAVFIYSALREERYLLEQFPNSYRQYKQRTKRLVPYVW